MTLCELGELTELSHWSWRTVNVTLGELGELVALPHWRFQLNTTELCCWVPVAVD